MLLSLGTGCNDTDSPTSPGGGISGGGSGSGGLVTDSTLYNQTDWFFDDTKVYEIKITINNEYLHNVVSNQYLISGEKQYALASSMEIEGETINNIGIRSRGNFSIDNHKRQLKLSFDCDTPFTNAAPDATVNIPANTGRRFHGLKKINLRASKNDPTIIREKVAAYIFRSAGAIMPRISFAKLYINNEYWGLYLMEEQVDNTMIQTRFSEKSGNLYKGTGGAQLVSGSQDNFELKNNGDELGNRSDINNLVNNLATADSSTVGNFIDGNNAASYLAAVAVTGHWDSIARYNNDYLYHHSAGKFYYVTWDVDNTFGIGYFPVTESINSTAAGGNDTAVFSKFMANSTWLATFKSKLSLLTTSAFVATLHSKIDSWKALIQTAVEADTRRLVDWGTSSISAANTVFDGAFASDIKTTWDSWGGWGYSCSQGLKGWISERATSVQGQL